MKTNTPSNKIYDVATLLLISGTIAIMVGVLSLIFTMLKSGWGVMIIGDALVLVVPILNGFATLVRNAEMEIDERNRADYE